MSDSSQIHRGFMSLSCQFHSYVGFIADSCHFHVTFRQTELQTVSWQFHSTFMALSLKLMNDNLELWWWQSLTLKESAMKVIWKWHESDLLEIDNFEVVESAMNLPWKWHEIVWGAMFGVEMKIDKKAAWKCHESAMKVPWKWHEPDMNMTWIWYSGFWQFFMADSWRFHGTFLSKLPNCWNPPYHTHLRFMSLSCHFHGAFMALSTKQSSKQFHAIFMALFLKIISKLS